MNRETTDSVVSSLEEPPASAVRPPVSTRAQELPFGELHWEYFERLCFRLARMEADVEHCQRYGVAGQDQGGIDVYARMRDTSEYVVYQCKQVKRFGPGDIRSAIEKFLAGMRNDPVAGRATRFVLCTSENMESTACAREIERQRDVLAKRNVAFTIWDTVQLSLLLKDQRGLVQEFFGQAWANLFCGDPGNTEPTSANEALIQRYLHAFRDEMQSTIDKMLLLSAQSTPSAVSPPAEKRSFMANIIVSPLQPGNRGVKMAHLDPDDNRKFDTFEAAFNALKKRVLLLGIPGAGKTTTLLQFAIQAADARIKDPGKPIPIFASIHRWDQKAPLPEWTQAPIQDDHDFEGICFKKQTLLYLFDGLDELGGAETNHECALAWQKKDDPRLTFLKAVEEQLPYDQVVISCRVLDYQKIGEKAGLQGAVTLLPLKPTQIEEFLLARDQAPLWDALVADNNLLELAKTPLLLALLSQAAGEQDQGHKLELSGATKKDIFDYYIKQRFAHEAAKKLLPFDEQTTRLFLGDIGAVMWQHGYWSLPELDPDQMAMTIGNKWQSFVSFACSMHFLRSGSRGNIQFVHLDFRDYCAVPVLLEVLRGDDVDVRRMAAQALGRIGDRVAVPRLLDALRDDDGDVREEVVHALSEIGDPAAVSGLLHALSDTDGDVRRVAADALCKVDDPAAVPGLLDVLRDDDDDMRWRAANALGKIGDRDAVPGLLDALRDADFAVREMAANALSRIGASAVPRLLDALRDDDGDVLPMAAFALGKIGASAVPGLLDALRDDDGDVRWWAADALGRIGASAVPGLLDALRDDDGDVRQWAADALGRIYDPAAVPDLLDALNDDNALVCDKATQALQRMNVSA